MTRPLPYYGLILFFVLEYLRPNNYLPFLNAFHFNSIVPFLVLCAAIFSGSSPSNAYILRTGNTKTLLFFLFLIFVSVLTADVTLYAFTVMKTVLGYFLIFYVIRREVTDISKLKGIFAVLIFIHIAVLFLNPQLILNPEVRHYIASGAFLGDGNDFALSVSITIPMCLYMLLVEKGFLKKAVYLVALLILVAGVIGTSSRGGTLAMSAAVLYFWLKTNRKLISAVIIAILAGFVLMFAPPNYFERMQTIKTYETDGSAQGRLLAWGAGVRMALDNPVLGVGAGHFPVKYGVEYRPEGYGRTELPWSTAHSIYFVVLGELGFTGLLSMLFAIAASIMGNESRLRKIAELGPPEEKSSEMYRMLFTLNASMIAFAVGGAFLTAIYYPHLYVLMGLIGSARLIHENAPAVAIKERIGRPGSVRAVRA